MFQVIFDDAGYTMVHVSENVDPKMIVFTGTEIQCNKFIDDQIQLNRSARNDYNNRMNSDYYKSLENDLNDQFGQ